MRGTGFIIIPIFLLACDDNESIMIHTLDFRHPRTKLNNVQSSLHTNLNKLKVNEFTGLFIKGGISLDI